MPQPWYTFPIGHGYITSYNGHGTDTPHFADDVETPFHTPITALLSGTVKQEDYATWSGQPGGGEVFIQPDGGGPEYYYYHLDEIDVTNGQHLAAGQVVGLSGGQNSGGEHPVSPMWSSGAHTHVGYFTQYKGTPAGNRPYGPDITSLLQQAQSNPNGAIVGSAGSSQAGSNGTSGGCWGVNVGGTCYGVPQPSSTMLWRAGYVVVGLLLVWLGLKHFLNQQNITIDLTSAGKGEQAGESETE